MTLHKYDREIEHAYQALRLAQTKREELDIVEKRESQRELFPIKQRGSPRGRAYRNRNSN